jgi:polyhydroxybutyrate depolymerase
MKIRFFLLIILLIAPVNISGAHATNVVFPGDRSFSLFVPNSYNSSNPAPLVIALTGYNQSGADFEKYLRLTPLAQADGFLYTYPDGSKDLHGIRFWNGTPECCDFQSPKVDDAKYIMSIIAQVKAKYSVDPNRIYIIGHSNGGFLANNLACNYSDQIAAIVNMAGGSYTKQSACKPNSPISVLEIWGTADDTYAINHILGKPIPGALKIFSTWGATNHCSTPLTLPQKLDLDSKITGAETTVVQFQNCPAGTAIDFWRIVGAGHAPNLTVDFDPQIINWLMAHPKVPTN